MLHSELILDGELTCDKASYTGDALLSVEDLVQTILVAHEVNEAERVPLQQGIDYGNVAPPLVVYVVALIFGLDDELSAEAIHPLALISVVPETFADIAYSPFGVEIGLH